VALLALTVIGPAEGSGHGPVFGLATPTLGKGGLSLDLAAMSRGGDADGVMLRPMLSFGVTADVQLSLSAPFPLGGTPARFGRGMALMPASGDVEVLAAWRFHRQSRGVGARFESTVFVGLTLPALSSAPGVEARPGLIASAVTGYASRSVYAWLGGLYRGSRGDEATGDVAQASLVLGYRPARFRRDDAYGDWRGFLEVLGERQDGASALYAGPTLLGLHGPWGLSAGAVFRVATSGHARERAPRVRVAVNVTYWF